MEDFHQGGFACFDDVSASITLTVPSETLVLRQVPSPAEMWSKPTGNEPHLGCVTGLHSIAFIISVARHRQGAHTEPSCLGNDVHPEKCEFLFK